MDQWRAYRVGGWVASGQPLSQVIRGRGNMGTLFCPQTGEEQCPFLDTLLTCHHLQ